MITTVSLGTTGKNASIIATAKIAAYDQSLETHCSNWSNTASMVGEGEDRHEPILAEACRSAPLRRCSPCAARSRGRASST